MTALKETHLRFVRQHRSIKHLPDTSLPKFCVLTGINGSGKTHLLEAIEQGAVAVEGIPQGHNLIRRFDWTNFAAQIDEGANPAGIRQQREQIVQQVIAAAEERRNHVPNFIRQHQIVGSEHLYDPLWLLAASEESLQAEIAQCRLRDGQAIGTAQVEQITQSIFQHVHQFENDFESTVENWGTLIQVLKRRATELGKSVLSLNSQEIRQAMPLTWTSNDALQFQLATWFAAWHAAWEYNRINRFYATNAGETHRVYLSDDDFRKQYGPEPWNLTNEILKRAGVRYQFNRPSASVGSVEQNFDLRLLDPDDSTEIRVGDLSSGEKVLLAITLLLFQSTGEIGLVRMPQLLLLDEVDAPLHPSFTKILVDVLHENLVGECGLAVILTTHAPSTVALSPVDAVYELIRRPRAIRKATRSEATQILSSGYISITSSDVIVITESSADPQYLSAGVREFLQARDNVRYAVIKVHLCISADGRRERGRVRSSAQLGNETPRSWP